VQGDINVTGQVPPQKKPNIMWALVVITVGLLALGASTFLSHQNEIAINAKIETHPITFLIDRAVLTKSLKAFRRYEASEGSTFLLLYFSARNDGREPFPAPTEPFFLLTDDSKRFEPDYEMSRHARESEDFDPKLELQPGLEKPSVNVFEIPLQQLSKHPTLHVVTTDGFTGDVPLFPRQEQPTAPSEQDGRRSNDADEGAATTTFKESEDLPEQAPAATDSAPEPETSDVAPPKEPSQSVD